MNAYTVLREAITESDKTTLSRVVILQRERTGAISRTNMRPTSA
jgi:non-homologous end joining protein Ku